MLMYTVFEQNYLKSCCEISL